MSIEGSSHRRGMTTNALAEKINLKILHLHRNEQPVTSNKVYAVAMRFPELFVKDGRLIRLDKIDAVRKRPIPSIERLIVATKSAPFDA